MRTSLTRDSYWKPKTQFVKLDTSTNSSIVELKQEFQLVREEEESNYDDSETKKCEPECIIKYQGVLEGGNQNFEPEFLSGEKWLLERRANLTSNIGYNKSMFNSSETKRKHPDWFFNSLYRSNDINGVNHQTVTESENSEYVKPENPQLQMANNMGWILAKTEDEQLELIPVVGVPETHATTLNLNTSNIPTLGVQSKAIDKQHYALRPDNRESERKIERDQSKIESERLRSMLESCQEKLIGKRRDWKRLNNAYHKLKRSHRKIRTALLDTRSMVAMEKKNSCTQTENGMDLGHLSSSKVREFSLNLYRISPEAYSFVEKCFNSLPDSKTVSEWSTVLAATEQLSCMEYKMPGRLWVHKDAANEQRSVFEGMLYDSEVSFGNLTQGMINENLTIQKRENNSNFPSDNILDLTRKTCPQDLEGKSLLLEERSEDRVKVISNYPSELPQMPTSSPEKHFDDADHFEHEDYLSEKCYSDDHNYTVETV